MASNSKNIAELLNGDTTITASDLSYPLTGFSSTGIDDNADAVALTIDSSENVLVGKTTIATGTAGIALRSNGEVRGTVSGGASARFSRLSSDGDIVGFEKDGASVGSVATYGGDLIVGTGDTRLRFVDSLDSVLPVSNSTGSSRDAGIDLGHSETRYKDIYTSGGIYLGAASNSTPVAANYLEDYEEGSWTPSLTNVSGSSITFSGSTNGRYTKIGRLVHVSFSVDNFSVSGGTGGTTINISGLPFTTQGSGIDSNGSVLGSYNISWSRTDFVALRTYAATTLGFLVSNTGNSWMWENINAFSGSNKYINGTITYMTTA